MTSRRGIRVLLGHPADDDAHRDAVAFDLDRRLPLGQAKCWTAFEGPPAAKTEGDQRHSHAVKSMGHDRVGPADSGEQGSGTAPTLRLRVGWE